MERPPLNSRKIRKAIQEFERLDLSLVSEEEIEQTLGSLLDGYASSVPVFQEKLDVWRAVSLGRKPVSVSEISYPPEHRVKSYGRGNKINNPVFYCATARSVPFFELDVKVGDHIAISKWRTQPNLVLNHIGFTEETKDKLASKRELEKIYEFVADTNKSSELNEMVHEYLGYIFSKPVKHSEIQEYYKLTSCLAERMMRGDLIHGLLYPTVQMAGNADNIILKRGYVDSHLEFVNVEYVRITEAEGMQYKIDTIDSAANLDDDGNLNWSGRPLQWQLTEAGQEVVATAENGRWVVRDKNGNVIDEV